MIHAGGPPTLGHVDVHPGPRGHTHLDLRYLLDGGDADPQPPPGESQDVGWFSWDEALAIAEPHMQGILRALAAAERVSLAPIAMDVISLHGRCVAEFVARVAAVPADRWDAPTPCSIGTHAISSTTSSARIAGRSRCWRGRRSPTSAPSSTVTCSGTTPRASARRAADEAVAMVAEALPAGGRVHLSYGDEDMAEYVRQLAADHLIHALGPGGRHGRRDVPRRRVGREVAEWFGDREALYRSAGAIGPRVEGTFEDPAGAVLLAAFGRHPRWSPSA